MKVTITEYDRLADDENGNVMPVGGRIVATQKMTAAGTAAALSADSEMIRVSTDTAIHIKVSGAGVDDTYPMMPANSVEWFNAPGALTPSIIAA